MANKYAPIVAKLQGQFFKKSLLVPPLSEEHLSRIEAQLRHRLPNDYREFLRDYGGVCFTSAFFPFNGDNLQRESSIFMFYGSAEEQTLADTYYQVQKNLFGFEDVYEWYPGLQLIRDISTSVTELGWPEELLPIGSDQGGNQICLALFGLRPAAIFWWRSNPHPNSDNLYLIADSFDEFMNLLRPETTE